MNFEVQIPLRTLKGGDQTDLFDIMSNRYCFIVNFRLSEQSL